MRLAFLRPPAPTNNDIWGRWMASSNGRPLPTGCLRKQWVCSFLNFKQVSETSHAIPFRCPIYWEAGHRIRDSVIVNYTRNPLSLRIKPDNNARETFWPSAKFTFVNSLIPPVVLVTNILIKCNFKRILRFGEDCYPFYSKKTPTAQSTTLATGPIEASPKYTISLISTADHQI